jgi:hypothetical protein
MGLVANTMPWPLWSRNWDQTPTVGPRPGIDEWGKSRTPHTGKRSPDRPASNELLFRLSNPGSNRGAISKILGAVNTGCFKKSFTTLKAYRNLYRGHTQRCELSKCSKPHRVLPRIVIRNCFDLFFRFLLYGTSTVTPYAKVQWAIPQP